jgi:hypothetical protein
MLCVCVCVNVCMAEMWDAAKNSKPAFILHRLLRVRNLVFLMYRHVLQIYRPPIAFIASGGLVYLNSAEIVRPLKC